MDESLKAGATANNATLLVQLTWSARSAVMYRKNVFLKCFQTLFHIPSNLPSRGGFKPPIPVGRVCAIQVSGITVKMFLNCSQIHPLNAACVVALVKAQSLCLTTVWVLLKHYVIQQQEPTTGSSQLQSALPPAVLNPALPPEGCPLLCGHSPCQQPQLFYTTVVGLQSEKIEQVE